MPAISYSLAVDGASMDPDTLSRLQQIEIEDHAEMAAILRLTFAIAVDEGGKRWTVLDDGIFNRLTNVQLKATVGSNESYTLIDAYVIETNVAYSNEPGETRFNVIAMDATVLMNLEEKIRSWPDMADSDIAAAIFDEYTLEPVVESTQPTREEVATTVFQHGTDIQFLKMLAVRNGYEVYVDVAPGSGKLRGHFHPPKLDEAPQGVLSINMGQATNVTAFSVRYDMLRPAVASGSEFGVDTASEQNGSAGSQSQVILGEQTTLSDDKPRALILSQTGLVEAGELQAYAQAVVDRSAFAIRAEGELDTQTYSRILRSKQPVLVRGAGQLLSGQYYTERVLHVFSGDAYTQSFTLIRNATGQSGQEEFKENNALP